MGIVITLLILICIFPLLPTLLVLFAMIIKVLFGIITLQIFFNDDYLK